MVCCTRSPTTGTYMFPVHAQNEPREITSCPITYVRTYARRNVRNIYTQHSCTTDYTATTVDSGAGMEHS